MYVFIFYIFPKFNIRCVFFKNIGLTINEMCVSVWFSALIFNATICFHILHICPCGAALITVHSQQVRAQ